MRTPPKFWALIRSTISSILVCGLLDGRVFGIFRGVTPAILSVTIEAVQTQGSGDEAHRGHEFVHWNSPEHLRSLKTSAIGGFAPAAWPLGPAWPLAWIALSGPFNRQMTAVPTKPTTTRLDPRFISFPSIPRSARFRETLLTTRCTSWLSRAVAISISRRRSIWP